VATLGEVDDTGRLPLERDARDLLGQIRKREVARLRLLSTLDYGARSRRAARV